MRPPPRNQPIRPNQTAATAPPGHNHRCHDPTRPPTPDSSSACGDFMPQRQRHQGPSRRPNATHALNETSACRKTTAIYRDRPTTATRVNSRASADLSYSLVVALPPICRVHHRSCLQCRSFHFINGFGRHDDPIPDTNRWKLIRGNGSVQCHLRETQDRSRFADGIEARRLSIAFSIHTRHFRSPKIIHSASDRRPHNSLRRLRAKRNGPLKVPRASRLLTHCRYLDKAWPPLTVPPPQLRYAARQSNLSCSMVTHRGAVTSAWMLPEPLSASSSPRM